ncbi:hypothetical protein B0F90DRAFT_1813915 [Multifurca ochricompacta]|uniref:Uncharacterized protein n=1 Tax=Multifurca ochricompacta TaxID=376703 RepID=A0AAD4QQX5_9AGAM|nr:hypothetical protein B0F90DRAFT_1813915 [Multifurca ochricompacta]
MSLHLGREFYLKSPSPSSSDTSTSFSGHVTPPRCPQRDFIYPRPVQSLPPLRAFLRDEGIDTEIELPQPPLVGASHDGAGEEACRRALRVTATRYGRHIKISPLLDHELRSSTSIDEHPRVQSLDEPSSYQKVIRSYIPSQSATWNDRHIPKTFSSVRLYGSRVGTFEERMSREVQTFKPPHSPTLPSKGNKIISPIPSRKRLRPVCFEHSDDDDSERDSSGLQTDAGDVEMTDSDSRNDSDEKGTRPPPRISKKPSGKLKTGKCLDDGREREYFSPSGVKLEVIELPVKYDTKEWLKHVEQCPDGSRAPWRCTWQTMKNGNPVPCDYSSKKHLVKRHIEATHLCIKFVLTKFGSLFVH